MILRAVGVGLLFHATAFGRSAPLLDAIPTVARSAQANDNRVAAGRLESGTLTLALELRETIWTPGGPRGRAIPVFAFAEAGKESSIPGPLIRVPAGTNMHMLVHNLLDRRAVVHGLHDHDGLPDSVVLAAGEERTITFRAVTPGTQFYWARTQSVGRVIGRHEDSQLVGGFIVDAAGSRPLAAERVLLISAFDDSVRATGFPADHFQVFALNGRSWPSTERLSYALGDTVRWRVINASDHIHPMHLHGFYFSVVSLGSELRDTVYAVAGRHDAVTELLRHASAVSLEWVASRSGNWLYHCHMIDHIATALRLDTVANTRHMGADSAHSRVEDMMSGLVMAIAVRDQADVRTAPARRKMAAPTKALNLFVTERPASGGELPSLSYVLQRGGVRPAADSVERPGTTLVLHQREPTEILVTNLMQRATAVHWHGLELESYFDGVAGWSGTTTRSAPLIKAGKSFAVRITPPRAGTFIYHTHVDETTQLKAGLYGAFIVLPEGVAQRDTTERLLILTEAGLEQPDLPRGAQGIQQVVTLGVGVTHRLRIVSIPATVPMQVRLLRDTTTMRWRPIAKDGADLPAAQAVERPAISIFGAGETQDVEVRLMRAETLTLEIALIPAKRIVFRIPVIVR